MFRIKICGVTRPEDAAHAVACGAEAIGINFFPGSPRFVPADRRPGDRGGGGGSGGGRRGVRERGPGDDRGAVRAARDPPGSASRGRASRGRLPHPALADEGGPRGSHPGSSGAPRVSVRGVPVRRRRQGRLRRDGSGTGVGGARGAVPGGRGCARSGRRAEAVAPCGRAHAFETSSAPSSRRARSESMSPPAWSRPREGKTRAR